MIRNRKRVWPSWSAGLLDEGTENRTSLEIAEAIESVGGAIEADGSFERIVVSAGVLTKTSILAWTSCPDLLIRPIFPQEYVDKEKERTLVGNHQRARTARRWLPGGHSTNWSIRIIPCIVRRMAIQRR